VHVQEARPQRVVIDARRSSLRGQLLALWNYRDLTLLFGRRDISVRYRQTGLGVAWVLLQPVLGALLLSFVFTQVAHVDTAETDYFSFALAGLALWTFFANLTSRSSLSLLSNAGLLSKSFFPRLVLPFATLPAAALDLAVALTLVVVVGAARGTTPSVHILLLPVAVLPVAMTGLGLGLISSALSVRFRDIQQVVPVALQLGLYASPVAYPASAVPASLHAIYVANPLVGPLDCFRNALLGRPPVDVGSLTYAYAVGASLLIAGAMFFIRREESFADVA
jgi:lipopolysaccharide transport system permease protein